MKKFITILLISLATTSFAAEKQMSFCVVEQNDTDLVVGKTYKTTKNELDLTTTETSTFTTLFPNNILVKVYENSKFLINDSFLEVEVPEQPSVFEPTQLNYTFALMSGEIDIINNNDTINKNSYAAIYTPKVTLIAENCNAKIISEYDMTTIYVYKGTIVANRLVEGRRYRLNEGKVGVVTRYVGPDRARYVNRSSIHEKLITDEEKNTLSEIFIKLNSFMDDILFAFVNDDIVGIKLLKNE